MKKKTYFISWQEDDTEENTREKIVEKMEYLLGTVNLVMVDFDELRDWPKS